MNFLLRLRRFFEKSAEPQLNAYETGRSGATEAAAKLVSSRSHRSDLVKGALEALKEGRPQNIAAMIEALPKCEIVYLPHTMVPNFYNGRDEMASGWLQQASVEEIKNVFALIPSEKRKELLDEMLIYALQETARMNPPISFMTLLEAGADPDCRMGAPLRLCAYQGVAGAGKAQQLIAAGASVSIAEANMHKGLFGTRDNEANRRERDDYSQQDEEGRNNISRGMIKQRDIENAEIRKNLSGFRQRALAF